MKGFLPPRVELNDATLWTLTGTVIEGMVIYSEGGTVTNGFYYWDGTLWQRLSTAEDAEWRDGTIGGIDLIFANQANANGNDVVISDDGRLGIGTTSTGDGLLTIDAQTSANGVFNFAAEGSPHITLRDKTGGNFSFITGFDAGILIGSRLSEFNTAVSGGVAPVANFYIDEIGNIGIGTLSPTRNLHIQDDINGEVGLFVENLSTGIDNKTNIQINAGNGQVGGVFKAFGDTYSNAYLAGNSLIANGTSATNGRFFIGGREGVALYSRGNENVSAGTRVALFGLEQSNRQIIFDFYDNAKDSTALVAPQNFLYTDNTGKLFSGSFNAILDATKDHDWYEVGTTDAPDNIEDNIFTQGNVGIGTTSPEQKLHSYDEIDGAFTGLIVDNRKTYGVGTGINETAKIDLSLSEALHSASSRVMGYIEAGTHSEMSSLDGWLAFGSRFGGANVERMRITSTGNVGIGTTNPIADLHVNSTGADRSTIYAGATGTGEASIYLDASNGDFIGTDYLALIQSDDLKGHLWVNTGPSSSPNLNSVLALQELGGRVGIGTVNPQEVLEVNGTIEIGGNENPDDTRINFAASNKSNRFQIETDLDANNALDKLGFRSSVADDILVLTGAGRVGLGTNDPTNKLQVNGDTRIGLINPPNTGTFPSEGNRLYFSGGNAGPTHNSDNSDPIYMYRHNSASDASQLRVNLGDNAHAADALVIGRTGGVTFIESIRLQNDGVAQKPGGGAWATLSDKRTKKDIIPFGDGLSVLNKINPVTYKYNGLYNSVDDGKDYVGIITQDVQKVAPYMIGSQEAARTAESTIKEEILNYDGGTYMLYVLVNSVKEQQAQIEALKKQNNALATKSTQLEGRVNEIDELKAQLKEIQSLLKSTSSIK